MKALRNPWRDKGRHFPGLILRYGLLGNLAGRAGVGGVGIGGDIILLGPSCKSVSMSPYWNQALHGPACSRYRTGEDGFLLVTHRRVHRSLGPQRVLNRVKVVTGGPV